MKLLLIASAVCVILLPLAARAAQAAADRDMVYIPAGEFLMGTAEAEARRLAEQAGIHPTHFLTEAPQRKVSVKAFLIDRTPVTNAHYSCLHSRPRWPDIPPGEERAVTGKLYFIKGGPDDLLERWKADFGRK